MASDPRIAKKSSMGRQKIEIKKVEQSNKRHVTFSKRKLGLFRKATELSILCQAEIAVIVFSQSGRLYASGHPDPDSVIYRYLSGGSSSSTLNPTEQNPEAATLSQQYEEAVNQLEAEKQCLKMMTEIQAAGCGHGFWWDQGIEDMGLEEIEQFKECLEELKQNLVAAAEEKEKEKARLMKSSMPETPPEFSYLSLLNGDGSEDQALDYWMGTDSGSSMAPYLGHCD